MRDKDAICSAVHRATWLLALFVTTWLLLPGASTPAQAAVYKCVGADGSTTYNDAPCAADESTHRLSKSARRLNVLDCRIAYNFAYDAVARMRQNDSATDVFQAYGGAGDMTESARTLVNYVYTFESDRLTSAQRIVDLATERCQAGLLGSSLDQCKSFPALFIERFGSCMKARQIDQTVLIQSPQLSSRSQSNGQSNTQAQTGGRLLTYDDRDNKSAPTSRAASATNADNIELERPLDKRMSNNNYSEKPTGYRGDAR